MCLSSSSITHADRSEDLVVADFHLLQHTYELSINRKRMQQVPFESVYLLKIANPMIAQRNLAGICCMMLLVLSNATLSVYNQQALGDNNPAFLNIQYSIANFGFVPYGKTIIARLMHSPDFSSECVIDPNEHTNFENSFLLIPRGECEFVTKALNAQKLGAQMAIIMDDKQHDKMVIMTDNNYGYKVKIPSIFINHNDGLLLKELIEENDDVSVMMKITFQNQKTDKVDLTFWLQANNRQSYRLVQDFRKHYPLIKQQVKFEVVYSNIACTSYCRESDCYFQRQYCATNLIHQKSATGRLILDQQIREQITLNLYPDQWWKYMKYIDDTCSAVSELKECAAQGMKKYEIDPAKVETAFAKSFKDNQDNTYLKKSREVLANSGVTKFPTVTINNVKVKGSLNAEFIFDDVCNTLKNPPSACSKYIESQTTYVNEVTNEWSTLLFVVVLSVIIFSLIFVAYRRYMKRKISSQMQSRVDETVSKYVQFYSQRSGRK